jgi:beta-glucosidase
MIVRSTIHDDRGPVSQLLAAMTLKEKVALLAGKNMWETANIDRLGIKSLKMTDGPAGVRGAKWIHGSGTTMIPCGISLGATFDPALIERLGRILGAEAKSKQAHLLLAPTMNMSRSPLGGRNFENFGEDPCLTGTLATGIVRGIQSQGVGACLKHYVGNEQESRRFNIDEEIDERTLREVYLRPFQQAVAQAGPWAVMTSYNKVNGEHVDMSRFLLDTVLRQEWAYDGLTVSDWGGLNDTVQSILAGLDIEMPGPPVRRGACLLEAIRADQLREEDLDPCVDRLLNLLNLVGLIDDQASPPTLNRPDEDYDESSQGLYDVSHGEKPLDSAEVRELVKQVAIGGIVLLKNDNNTLPLSSSQHRRIAVLGPNAKNPTAGGSGSAAVNPYYMTNLVDSIEVLVSRENPKAEIRHERGIIIQKLLPVLKNTVRTPAGDAGFCMDFYRGHKLEGDIVGSLTWATSQIFIFSDGEIPSCLKGQPYSFRLHGIVSPEVSGEFEVGLSSTGKSKLYIDNELILDNSNWTELGEGFMNCNSAEIRAKMSLEAGKQYHFRVDQVAVPPPLPPHDNTLFHMVSGVRIGLLPPTDEDELFQAAVCEAMAADQVILVVGHNNDTERERRTSFGRYVRRIQTQSW